MIPTFSTDRFPDEQDCDFAARFYLALRDTKQVFRKEDGSIVIVKNGSSPLRIGNMEEFRGLIRNVIQATKSISHGRTGMGSLTYDDASLLYFSEEKNVLPRLTAVVFEPAVVPTPAGYGATVPGYSEENGIFYRVDGDPIVPVDGTRHIEEALSGVPFETQAYRNNLIAYWLGAILLDPRVESPMLVVTGNKQNIGKSKVVEATGILLTGQAQAPVPQRPEEMEKNLGARFADGLRFITMDNVTSGASGSYKNDVLSRLLTAGFSKRVRILGHSRSISMNGVLFALSANAARLETDLATRSLPVKLYAEISRPMVPYIIDYVQEHRRAIYGELLGLALGTGPFPAGEDHPTFRFRRWLDFVAPRIRAHLGDLAIEEAAELDDVILEVFGWGADHLGTPFTTRDFWGHVESSRDRFQATYERFGAVSSSRARHMVLAKFLISNTDRAIPVIRDNYVVLRHHSREQENQPDKFTFEEA